MDNLDYTHIIRVRIGLKLNNITITGAVKIREFYHNSVKITVQGV